MRVRIVKHLPAPLMDGFDVSRFRDQRIYEVDLKIGRYLVAAGYAVAVGVDERASDRAEADRTET